MELVARNVSQISNELEFSLENVSAQEVIERNGVPLVPEVNPQHIVEMNVSLANNVAELNLMVEDHTRRLLESVNSFNGRVYGGGSLLANVSNIVPAWYRTTALSKDCAAGFLDITSQQVVIGVRGESFGIDLYNYIRQINPVLLGLSNSSPFLLDGEELIDTGFESRRIQSYDRIVNKFPREIFVSPEIETMEQFYQNLQQVSDEVNGRLSRGEMDANMEELERARDGGPYLPFDCLSPHQLYWMTRIRPDHQNEQSDFSIELRVPDTPTTITRMQMINSLAVGLAYEAVETDFDLPHLGMVDELEALRIAATDGLSGRLNGRTIGECAAELTTYAERGLARRGQECEAYQLRRMVDEVLENGNDATLIREQGFETPDQLRNYLVNRLENGE